MKTYIFLVVNLALTSVFSVNNNGPRFEEIGEDKDITVINNGSLQDDILKLEVQRSAIFYKERHWTSPVPYVLEENLEMNAKGVILRAFDQFRLKSCIDFTPRTSENYYLSIQKSNGCYSYIGRVIQNGQILSIGQYCDEISTVEHEILHALGFFHEQSRYDRDNYVIIRFENILEGREGNFDKASEEYTTTNGVMYDYWSVMHYGAYAFSNGNGTTIETTKNNSRFQSIIGQRLEMSPSDVLELNLLYECNSTIAFKMHCSFSDAAMCQMTPCSRTNNHWRRVKAATGGPNSDHTSLPTGNHVTGEHPGYFMHVSTASGQEGDSARLETKRMKVNRQCHIQCLQFYYFHSGNPSDVLNVWLREFHDETDVTGHRRLVGQITGPPTSHWQIHHVSLNASTFFQVEFEVRKGTGSSSGGISIDDINLSEIECPHVTMQIDDFKNVLNSSSYGSVIYSPRQYSTTGYAYRVGVILYQTYAGVFVQMMSGKNDDHLEWPVHNRQVTLMNVDQDPNIQEQMSKQRSITADRTTSYSGGLLWDNPRNSGDSFVGENNETVFVGPLIGRSYFVHFPEMTYRSYLKGNSAVFTFSFHDLTPLVNGSELPCPVAKAAKITHPPTDRDQGPCSPRLQTTSSPHHTTHHPHSTEDPYPTYDPPRTTDPSIFGNAPGKVASFIHILILLSALLLLIP
ncbi:meprin A subunit beta-like [Sphaeramia orbicularis]|uniref:Metalloendopeptidase n=1 Tax=Sphaeramia orbicularis TaxID=375764 RepID=A0A672Y6E1_9TELE|nr:meprin A subunit beta-like [Sphaeramia orbicularis]